MIINLDSWIIASSHSLVHYFLLSDIDRNYYINLHGNATTSGAGRAVSAIACKGYLHTCIYATARVLPHLLAAHTHAQSKRT